MGARLRRAVLSPARPTAGRQDRSQGKLLRCQDGHRGMRKTNHCFPEPGNITWLPVPVCVFCLCGIAGCWQLERGGERWEAGTSRGSGTMGIPCPRRGTVLLLGSGSCPGWGCWSLSKGTSLPAPCGWWGGQGHRPAGMWGQAEKQPAVPAGSLLTAALPPDLSV